MRFLLLIVLLSPLSLAAQELCLEQVWEYVMEHHEEVKRLALDNKQARLNVRQTIGYMLPKVAVSGSLTYSNPSKAVDGSRIVPSALRVGNLTLAQPLWDCRFGAARKGARWAQNATEHQTEYELYELLYLASESYLAVLQSRELFIVSEQQLALANQQLETSQKLYDNGEAPLTDMLRAEEEVKRAERALFDISTDIQIYTAHLSNFIGEPVCEETVLLPPSRLLCQSESMDELVGEALANRRDLQSLASIIEASRFALKGVKRTNWPRVEFLGDYTLASPETLSMRNNDWSAAFWLSLPLYDGGINRCAVKKAAAELEKQQLLYARRLKDVEVEVKSVYYALESARANVALLEKELQLAEESYALLSERYQKGLVPSLDLMAGFAALMGAKAGYANAHYNLILLCLKLRKETGLFDQLLNGAKMPCIA